MFGAGMSYEAKIVLFFFFFWVETFKAEKLQAVKLRHKLKKQM